MSDEQGAVQRPRPLVFDVPTSQSHASRNHSRSRGKKKHHRNDGGPAAEHVQQWPLESQGILRSVLEYGRRTHAIGAGRGASALKALACRLRSSGLTGPDVDQIVADAESAAAELTALLSLPAFMDD